MADEYEDFSGYCSENKLQFFSYPEILGNSDLEIEQAISHVKEAVQQIMKIQQYLGDDVEITTT